MGKQIFTVVFYGLQCQHTNLLNRLYHEENSRIGPDKIMQCNDCVLASQVDVLEQIFGIRMLVILGIGA